MVRKHSEETKRKISDVLKGRTHSKEAKLKMSLIKKGKIPKSFNLIHNSSLKKYMDALKEGSPKITI